VRSHPRIRSSALIHRSFRSTASRRLHTHRPRSTTVLISLFLRLYDTIVEGWWCFEARKVTVGLVSHWPCISRLHGLYHLWAQRPNNGRWAPSGPTILWTTWHHRCNINFQCLQNKKFIIVFVTLSILNYFSNRWTTITTSRISNIESFTCDKWEDIFNMYIYYFTWYANKFGNRFVAWCACLPFDFSGSSLFYCLVTGACMSGLPRPILSSTEGVSNSATAT